MNPGWIQALLLAALLVVYLLGRSAVRRFVGRWGREHGIAEARILYVTQSLQLALLALVVVAALLTLNVRYGQITIFLTSMVAVLGVALFAQWSILSNLSASLIIFFGFPYRIGDVVKVVDKDEDIRGTIEAIGAFHVQIRRAGGDVVSYPNCLILQKAVIQEPRPTPAAPALRRFARRSGRG